MNLYDKKFFSDIYYGSINSANEIIPKVLEIFSVDSAIDFGCGTGAWLSVLKEHGCSTVLGLDSSTDSHEMLDESNFELIDLSKEYKPKIKYDLAISLEVAEHVEEQYSGIFVSNLVNSSDNIMWSAAIPNQGGVGHVNEKWPSFWVEKFANYGYSCNGSFRYQFWFNEKVEPWYRQNLLLFSRVINFNQQVRDLVHPYNYDRFSYIEEEFKYDKFK